MSSLGRTWAGADRSGPALQVFRAVWRERLAAGLDGLTPLQRGLLAGAVVVALVLLVVMVWGPAWSLWRSSEQRHAHLDAAWTQMQTVAAQADALRSGGSPRLSPEQSANAVRSLTQTLLGEGAQVTAAGTQLTVRLQAVPAAGLSRWLTQVRERVGAKPESVAISHDAQANQWSGQMVLALPETTP